MSPRQYLKNLGLESARGAAFSVTVLIVDPLKFNPFAGASWGALGKIAITMALVKAAVFVANANKQQP